MMVRYFAAAKAAAGSEEETFTLAEPATLADVISAALSVSRSAVPAGTPPLERVFSRSSFLLNGVAIRDHSALVGPADVVDVLPPFAGG